MDNSSAEQNNRSNLEQHRLNVWLNKPQAPRLLGGIVSMAIDMANRGNISLQDTQGHSSGARFEVQTTSNDTIMISGYPELSTYTDTTLTDSVMIMYHSRLGLTILDTSVGQDVHEDYMLALAPDGTAYTNAFSEEDYDSETGGRLYMRAVELLGHVAAYHGLTLSPGSIMPQS